MDRFGKTVTTLGSLAALFAVGSFLPQPGVASPNSTPQQVLVVNASGQPVPVNGSVSAAQSGTWNVGITGTPTVNIGNSVATQMTATTGVLLNLSKTAAPSSYAIFDAVDVSSAKEVRINCTASSTTSNSNFLRAWSIENGQVTVPFDFQSGDNLAFTQLIELPGSQLEITALNLGSIPVTYSCTVYGRVN